jgi:hypothetical protein
VARYSNESIFRISPKTFTEIDEWITAAETSGKNVAWGMEVLLMLMARTNQAEAKALSRGPVDPQMNRPDTAWKLPVRRITSRYYKGWKVRRLGSQRWALFNDTREAYFIEYGINHWGQGTDVGSRGKAQRGHMRVGGVQYEGGSNPRAYYKGSRRVRRPIRKLSLISTLKFMDQSKASARVWEKTYAPFRPGKRTYKGRGFVASDAVQGIEGMRNI